HTLTLPSIPYPSPPATHPLSLHDALPICAHRAENLRREPDRANRFGAEPAHHQHRGQPEYRVECKGENYRPRERPHLAAHPFDRDRKSTRLNSSHVAISYAVFCLKKKKKT